MSVGIARTVYARSTMPAKRRQAASPAARRGTQRCGGEDYRAQRRLNCNGGLLRRRTQSQVAYVARR